MFGPFSPSSQDYFVEVAKGNVQGAATRAIVMRSPSSGPTPQDLWGGNGNLVYPTAAESLELFCEDANDDASGTGARLVVVNTLNGDYVQQSQLVATNGGVQALTGLHFRPDGAFVVDSGSGQKNAGKITVRVAGGGAERQIIMPGFSTSEDGHYTVPAGKTAFALLLTPFYPKNFDGTVSGKVVVEGTNTILTSGTFPFYQSHFSIEFKALFPAPEKSDTYFQLTSESPGADVSMILEILILDN